MTEIETRIRAQLFAMQDLDYKTFHSRLMPTVDPHTVIGVRVPALRALAKQLGQEPEIPAFLRALPHTYYEENNLHGLLIAQLHDYARCVDELERFLPYVDNWATCDLISPKCVRHHLPEFLTPVQHWLASAYPYTVRFGIGMLLKFYLDAAFDPAYPALVAGVQSEEYYVSMMQAWYFATALAKQPDAALPYLEEHRLSPWVHNKTIQKAVESRRITDAQKAYLRKLKR